MRDKGTKKEYVSVALLILILAISLVPVVIIARYDCASGDDYGYGARSHLAYMATGSVIQAVKEAVQTTIGIYHGWQGTWFDCFVFCLHPEVFSDTAYVIVPYIFVIGQIICYCLLAHHFLKVRWNFPGMYWLIIALIFLTFSFQLVPSQKSAIFWWVGCIHYVMPMCLAIVGVVAGDNYLMTHKTRYLVALTIAALFMGGATYPAALLLIEAMFVLWLADFVIGKVRDKRNFWLLLPFLVEIIGLIISALAPGNAVRSASDISNGATPANGIVDTVISSITYSIKDAAVTFIGEKTLILFAFAIIAVISWMYIKELYKNDEESVTRIFSHPILFLVTAFLINASIYAPRIYAGGVVSSGYFNFNFWTFFICCIASIVYIEGWLVSKDLVKVDRRGVIATYAITIIVLFIALYFGRHGIKKYTDYVCMEYYLTGQADDYLEQMKLQRELMSQEDVMDVVVPEINNEQGPLMHMPIVADPSNIDNTTVASFYGKNSCRSIHRPEWEALYGDQP
ncbi:hypothetical protein [Butyrivibrio sp. FCS006]|uniref:hypothetical protein n=1 Tax=Butyrivibrio sp. FCS006 TaxID=1280684 RepID=UPI0004285737|nr:hypothetical protein [Butyrivibrio sp. FCS006]